MRTEAETGPRNTEDLPSNTRSWETAQKETPPPTGCRGRRPCQHLDFGFPAPRTGVQFCGLRPPLVALCHGRPRKMTQS